MFYSERLLKMVLNINHVKLLNMRYNYQILILTLKIIALLKSEVIIKNHLVLNITSFIFEAFSTYIKNIIDLIIHKVIKPILSYARRNGRSIIQYNLYLWYFASHCLLFIKIIH